jgi:DnaK suppressor protein
MPHPLISAKEPHEEDVVKKETGTLTLKQYRELLLAKRADLRSESGEEAVGLAELGRVAEDDQAPILHDHFISLQVKQLDYQTLRQVDAALERLASGDFGICASCGRAISPKRLSAIPWAHCCIACQERVGSAHHPLNAAVRAA